MTPCIKPAICLVTSLLLLGCSSGSGGGGGEPPPPPPPPPPPSDPPNGATLEPTFTSIQANVFTPICTACHAGSLPPEGLRLDAASSYGMLVGIASVQVPSLQRVNPGNPNSSYLIQKLEGTAAVGVRMPADQPPLPQSTINVIRQWITDGAMQSEAASAQAVRASGASIVPNSLIESVPETLIVMFDRDLDVSTAQLTTVSLMRSGGDGSFDDGNEVEVAIDSVDVPLVNPRAIVIDLGGADDIEDVYRLVLSGSGPSAIQDLAGNRLDGNWVQTFPSGDGTQGGDLVIEFTVRR
jgi:hypothetical protein